MRDDTFLYVYEVKEKRERNIVNTQYVSFFPFFLVQNIEIGAAIVSRHFVSLHVLSLSFKLNK